VRRPQGSKSWKVQLRCSNPGCRNVTDIAGLNFNWRIPDPNFDYRIPSSFLKKFTTKSSFIIFFSTKIPPLRFMLSPMTTPWVVLTMKDKLTVVEQLKKLFIGAIVVRGTVLAAATVAKIIWFSSNKKSGGRNLAKHNWPI
jgi:hypothetical protein